jgi:hypothetical protein
MDPGHFRRIDNASTHPVLAAAAAVGGGGLADRCPGTANLEMVALRQYSTSTSYKTMFISQSTALGVKELWNAKASGKCLFFTWLVLHGRCWTSEQLQRHELQNNGPCALCSQEVELLDHLFLGCSYSREFLLLILSRVGGTTPCRRQWSVISVAWCLWLKRNDQVFSRASASAALLF